MTDLERERQRWESDPGDTIALLVVVDEYRGFDPIEGIAQQAARFASQLIEYGVKSRNVILLASQTARSNFPPESLWLGPADQPNISRAIQEMLGRPGKLLWMHWIGHGLYVRGEMMLLTADAEELILQVVELKRLLVLLELNDAVPRHQMFTIDACQQNWPDAQPIPLPNIAKGPGPNAEQFVGRGSRPGDAASNDARGGFFTEALMSAIDEVSEPRRWPPDVTRLAVAVTERLREALGGDVGRTQWVTKTPWEGEVSRTAELQSRGLRAPDSRRGLAAWAVPDDWHPGRYHTQFGSSSIVALDLRLVANRRRAFAFLADPPDADLADDLNRVEEILDGSPLGDVAPRRWFTVDVERHGDPFSVRDLGRWVLEQGLWRRDCLRGFVLRLDVAARQPVRHDLVFAWVRRIVEKYPDASIAVAVRAGYPTDAILACRQLGGKLTAASMALDQRDLFTRARPGESAGEDTTTDVAGPPFLPAVLDRLRTAARYRGLVSPFESVADASTQFGEQTLPSPAALALALVEEMEDSAFSWPGATPDQYPDEAFLCAVRDYAPGLFPHLVHAYAIRRTGVGWGVSLAVAAQFDQDLATWLSAATDAGRYPDPLDRSEWPPAIYRRGPADAVVLELARRDPPGPPGRSWVGDAWLPLMVSSSVAETLRLLRYAPSVGRPVIQLSRAPCDLITSLVVAIPDPVSLLGPNADCFAEQTWCAIRAAARSSGALWPMLRLLTERGDRSFARAVIGLEPLPAEAESLLREKADELHRFLYTVREGEP